MNFIIGGAYQGKHELAQKKFGITDDEVFICTYNPENDPKNRDGAEKNSTAEGMDFSRRCICHVERFALSCVKNGIEAREYFDEHKFEWADSVIICDDIFCGVVPIDADMRAWREMCGRLCTYLTKEADTVTRVFCGLEQKLK